MIAGARSSDDLVGNHDRYNYSHANTLPNQRKARSEFPTHTMKGPPTAGMTGAPNAGMTQLATLQHATHPFTLMLNDHR